MELLNFTKMVAGMTTGLRPDGREVLVVAVKGTFTIPADGKEPELAGTQNALADADTFTGEPGVSAPLCEADYAPAKSRCDVVLYGSAYAPGGRPVQRVPVALRVGTMAKTFQAVGHRTWTRGLASLAPSEPEYFTVLPVSYDNAFGGIDLTNPEKPRYFPANHAGRGFHHHLDLDRVVGKPLPNTEEIDNPISNPRGDYRPMAFGSIGRTWEPRPKYAGTYDQNWLDNVFPFLPADFRDDYYQSAPPDQQIPHLQGGEEVSLHNLTPQGRTVFKLPKIDLPIVIHLEDEEDTDGAQAPVQCDTLRLEPDMGQFSLVWRAQWPIRRSIHEIASVLVGKPPRAFEHAEATGKTYYISLAEAVE
jgi:hypothetical protein